MIALALALLAQAATPSPAPVVPQAENPAQQVWEKRCALCHGPDGKSATRKGRKLKAPDFTKPRWQKHTTDEEIVKAISDGIPKRKMPSFKDKLSEAEIQAMVPLLRAFAKK